MKYISIIVLIVLFGCQSVSKPEKPDNLIPKEKMMDIMMDSYLSNAARSVNNRKVRSYGLKLDSLIYAKYNVDSLQFANSNTYYAADLDTYEEMFKTIEERLGVLKSKADSIQKANANDKDATPEKDEEVTDTIDETEAGSLVPSINTIQDSIE